MILETLSFLLISVIDKDKEDVNSSSLAQRSDETIATVKSSPCNVSWCFLLLLSFEIEPTLFDFCFFFRVIPSIYIRRVTPKNGYDNLWTDDILYWNFIGKWSRWQWFQVNFKREERCTRWTNTVTDAVWRAWSAIGRNGGSSVMRECRF